MKKHQEGSDRHKCLELVPRQGPLLGKTLEAKPEQGNSRECYNQHEQCVQDTYGINGPAHD
jgi:hypothetical protein